MSASSTVTAVIGVGPGNGAAFARRFAAEGHRVGLLSRSKKYLTELADEIGDDAHPFVADASDPKSITDALAAVAERWGPIDNLLYNAGSGVFGSVDEVTAEDLEQAWRINTLGLFTAAQAVLPGMRAKGGGSIVITGATASLRGGAGFTAFAQAKAAQRSLAQSMAKKIGEDGVHVALVIVDGMIDLPRTREAFPKRKADAFLNPDDIASAVWFLSQQAKSAWTFELDVRPSLEKW